MKKRQKPSLNNIKGVIVGDASVGKTSMLVTITEGAFPAQYMPTSTHQHRGVKNQLKIVVLRLIDPQSLSIYAVLSDRFELYISRDGGQSLNTVQLWDTSALPDFDHLRPLAYPDTDVFLLFFSIANRASFENVRSKWCPEIAQHSPESPRILVGTKSDLRQNDAQETVERSGNESFVTAEQAEQMAADIGAVRYMEISEPFVFGGPLGAALKGDGLDDLVNAALQIGLEYQLSKRSSAKTEAKDASKTAVNRCFLM